MQRKHLGEHYILELFDCDNKLLNDVEGIKEIMIAAAVAANATIVTKYFHQFSPYGISGTIVIEESHFNIHTWPEHGFAAVDLFTCGDSLQPEKAKSLIIRELKSQNHDYSTIKRGVFKK